MLKILSGPSPLAKGLTDLSLSGLSSVFSSFSRAVDLHPHDELSLQNYLNNRIAFTEGAARRHQWFGGRWYNRMAGEDPHFVGMSGTHLMQVLSLVEVEPPDFIVNSGRYSLDVETTRMALTILDERIESGNR